MPDRRLVVTQNITANGVVEFLDPWFDPGDQGDADDLLVFQREQFAAEEVLLLGRQTFEDFRGYWPLQTDDATGVTEHLDRVRKVVVTSSTADPGWQRTTFLHGSLEDGVRGILAEGGGELGLTGSIGVLHALVRADLVDEYRLFVHPVLSSRGRTLVPDGVPLRRMALVGSRAFRAGVVLQTYART